ncbi:DUF3013 family protein [Lactococcus lactis]|uniref:DUF3013 family protein n=1 Tax=Lactococcus lactis TaxID=1358 RepID=UPI00223BAD26|nr:DUF3013 family protein [Lactococcus lactis]MCT1185024.1 DUF3013 family protein [Lactococcus lactis]MCT1189261.1 DUF3013 family protein [Lactococcus lactis]
MAKFGFLDVLEEVLEKGFTYDFEMNWDKSNFAVEVSFLLEAENSSGALLTDAEGVESAENIVYEDAVLFYNPAKSRFDENDYLATIHYGEKGLSREFLAYFAQFLQESADQGLDDLMDFLADEAAEEFSVNWDKEAFENGIADLSETDFYKYPRY